MNKKVKYNVDKFYFDNHRVTTIENTDEGFPKGEHGLKLYQHKDDISRVTFWGTHDGTSWKNNWPVRGRTDYPLLFDRSGKRKLAYDAVAAVPSAMAQ